MKRKITIIGTGAIAVVIGAVAIFSNKNTDSNEAQKVKETVVAENETEEELQTPVASGNINLSSVGVSSVIDTMDTAGTTNAEGTGEISYFNVGFADVVESYNDYLYNNDSITSEEVHEAVKNLDIATELVPEGSVIDGYTNLGISNADTYLNVRKGPGTSYKIIGKMPGYSVCEILEEKDGWYKIKSGDVTGYVSADYILTGYEANVKAMEKMTAVLEVNCDKLNVREEPSTECSVATKVSKGTHLDILEEEKDGWYKASINGLEGYVSAEYVDEVFTLPTAQKIVEVVASSSGNKGSYTYVSAEASQKAQEIINYAYQFLGNPYVYGGNSLTRGIDCSGFVKQIFAKFGYTLPRTSASYLSGVGTTIPLSDIQPGDILVYRYSNGGGHVAIYIGEGKIIHAANEKSGICISKYNFVTPRRAVRVIK